MLRLPQGVLDEFVAAAYDAYPYEACGLLAGEPNEQGRDRPTTATHFYRCRNAAESARVYSVDPLDHLRAERDAEDRGWAIVGVVHSHTHSEPFPSPTDIAQAPDPAWHYIIVGLKRESPETRSYRIVDEVVTEELIVLGP
ncbi:M67 family metallopeptidase [soil metagenome]